MSEEQKNDELTMPKFLDDIKGLPDEVRAQKVALISKFGYAEWEKLVSRSSIRAKR